MIRYTASNSLELGVINSHNQKSDLNHRCENFGVSLAFLGKVLLPFFLSLKRHASLSAVVEIVLCIFFFTTLVQGLLHFIETSWESSEISGFPS